MRKRRTITTVEFGARVQIERNVGINSPLFVRDVPFDSCSGSQNRKRKRWNLKSLMHRDFVMLSKTNA
jgi:hypothetical protein